MKWFLRLYPPEFQRRYRAEMEAQLSTRLPKLRTTLDLMAGAVDAWRNRDLIPQPLSAEGDNNMITASRVDGFEDVTNAEWMKGALSTIGVTLVLVAIGVFLDKSLGDNAIANALMFSSWLIGMALGARNTFLKPYSADARNVITIAVSAMAFVAFLLVFVLVQS